jgi:hypothetical protein
LKQGVIRPVEVADHVERVRSAKDPWLAMRTGKLASLCRDHHRIKTDLETGRQARRRVFAKLAFGADGWPITDDEWRSSRKANRIGGARTASSSRR